MRRSGKVHCNIILWSLEKSWAVWPERLRPGIPTPTRTFGHLLAPLSECVAFGLNGLKCYWVLACAPKCSWVCSWVLLGSSWVLVGLLVGGLGTLGVFLAAPGDPHKQRRVVAGQKVQ